MHRSAASANLAVKPHRDGRHANREIPFARSHDRRTPRGHRPNHALEIGGLSAEQVTAVAVSSRDGAFREAPLYSPNSSATALRRAARIRAGFAGARARRTCRGRSTLQRCCSRATRTHPRAARVGSDLVRTARMTPPPNITSGSHSPPTCPTTSATASPLFAVHRERRTWQLQADSASRPTRTSTRAPRTTRSSCSACRSSSTKRAGRAQARPRCEFERRATLAPSTPLPLYVGFASRSVNQPGRHSTTTTARSGWGPTRHQAPASCGSAESGTPFRPERAIKIESRIALEVDAPLTPAGPSAALDLRDLQHPQRSYSRPSRRIRFGHSRARQDALVSTGSDSDRAEAADSAYAKSHRERRRSLTRELRFAHRRVSASSSRPRTTRPRTVGATRPTAAPR